VLLLHPCGRLRVLLDIDILVHDTQAVQMSVRPLRVPTLVSPIDFNHTLVSPRRHSWSPWTTCTSQMHGCTFSTVRRLSRPVNRLAATMSGPFL